jgi:hypothetical protein
MPMDQEEREEFVGGFVDPGTVIMLADVLGDQLVLDIDATPPISTR